MKFRLWMAVWSVLSVILIAAVLMLKREEIP